MLRIAPSFFALMLALPATADCTFGAVDRFDGPGSHAALAQQTTGHLPIWIAEREGRKLVIAGALNGSPDTTSAFFDAAQTLARKADRVAMPSLLPPTSEVRALFADEPGLMVLQGTSLIDMLPPEDWATVDQVLRQDPLYSATFPNALLRPSFILSRAFGTSCLGPTIDLELATRFQHEAQATDTPVIGLNGPLAELRFLEGVDLDQRMRWMMTELALIEDLSAVGLELSDLVLGGLPTDIANPTFERILDIQLARIPADDADIWLTLDDQINDHFRASTAATLHRLGQDCVPVTFVMIPWHQANGQNGVFQRLAPLGWTITHANWSAGDDTTALMAPASLPCTG